jgi:hypothetical protein
MQPWVWGAALASRSVAWREMRYRLICGGTVRRLSVFTHKRKNLLACVEVV